jgi:hypothetical protein
MLTAKRNHYGQLICFHEGVSNDVIYGNGTNDCLASGATATAQDLCSQIAISPRTAAKTKERKDSNSPLPAA